MERHLLEGSASFERDVEVSLEGVKFLFLLLLLPQHNLVELLSAIGHGQVRRERERKRKRRRSRREEVRERLRGRMLRREGRTR